MVNQYQRRHRNTVRVRGKVADYPCIECGSGAQEWAQVHGTSGDDPFDYQPMCVSCHHRYDNHWNEETRRKVSVRMREIALARTPEENERRAAPRRGAKRTPEQVERMRIARWGR